MADKTTTNTTNQYNQGGMNNYNSFQGTLGTMLKQYASNPLGSSFFNQQYGAQLNNAQALTNRNQSNMFQNLRAGGGLIGNSGAFMQSQLNRNMLSGSSMASNAFNGSLTNALNGQKWALGSMQAYNPLATGQNSVQQQTPGLGSILGSVAGIGLNMAMPGMGSLLGGGKFSDGY